MNLGELIACVEKGLSVSGWKCVSVRNFVRAKIGIWFYVVLSRKGYGWVGRIWVG